MKRWLIFQSIRNTISRWIRCIFTCHLPLPRRRRRRLPTPLRVDLNAMMFMMAHFGVTSTAFVVRLPLLAPRHFYFIIHLFTLPHNECARSFG